MRIQIDEKKIEVTDPTLNIVQIARANGIIIPAPCFNTNHDFGCCKACAIEIETEIHYACCTKPKDSMKIIFDRNDLNQLRIERIKKYSENKQKGIISECDCSESNNDSSCGCGSGCC